MYVNLAVMSRRYLIPLMLTSELADIKSLGEVVDLLTHGNDFWDQTGLISPGGVTTCD